MEEVDEVVRGGDDGKGHGHCVTDVKWKGTVQAVLEAPLASVWRLASDGCGLPKWMPMVEECKPLHGVDGTPGFVRFLRGDMFPHENGEKSWIRERLLLMDSSQKMYAYSMEDGNIGLSGYVNTVQFSDFGDDTTLVHWWFEVDPVPYAIKEATLEYLSFLYKSSLKKLEIAAAAEAGATQVATCEPDQLASSVPSIQPQTQASIPAVAQLQKQVSMSSQEVSIPLPPPPPPDVLRQEATG